MRFHLLRAHNTFYEICEGPNKHRNPAQEAAVFMRRVVAQTTLALPLTPLPPLYTAAQRLEGMATAGPAQLGQRLCELADQFDRIAHHPLVTNKDFVRQNQFICHRMLGLS